MVQLFFNFKINKNQNRERKKPSMIKWWKYIHHILCNSLSYYLSFYRHIHMSLAEAGHWYKNNSYQCLFSCKNSSINIPGFSSNIWEKKNKKCYLHNSHCCRNRISNSKNSPYQWVIRTSWYNSNRYRYSFLLIVSTK